MVARGPSIERVDVAAYATPADRPASDGTLWRQATTMVTVHARAAGVTGFGFTYADKAAGAVIRSLLADCVVGRDALGVTGCFVDMIRAVRNNGDTGLCRRAVAAVDIALWDLKAKLLNVPLCRLLGPVREDVPVYGSGVFTSCNHRELAEQLGRWAAEGMASVKMKIGRDGDTDPARLQVARNAIGDDVHLYVDGNGAYTPRRALAMATLLGSYDVRWFEEPVCPRDVEALAFVHRGAPPTMIITGGQYAFQSGYARRMLETRSVDVLVADATRCGITGFGLIADLCQAYDLPLSSHGAPSAHLHPCLAAAPVMHMEYFHDHVRLEHMLLDGAATAADGAVGPDLSRPGLGIELRRADAERYKV